MHAVMCLSHGVHAVPYLVMVACAALCRLFGTLLLLLLLLQDGKDEGDSPAQEEDYFTMPLPPVAVYQGGPSAGPHPVGSPHREFVFGV